MEIQLKLLCQILEALSTEDDGVLQDSVVVMAVPAPHALQHPHGGRGDPVEPEAHVVSMGRRSVFYDNFSLTVRSGQVLQVL